MADFISLTLDKIHVPDNRSREVDEDYALTIQASMAASSTQGVAFDDVDAVRAEMKRRGR